MNNFDTIIDFGSKNLKLQIFDQSSKIIYTSQQQIIDNLEKSLNILIRDAEKKLATHIENVIVLYDSPKFYSLDLSIKKVFDHAISIKKIYNSLIDEAHFIISQNNFKDQIIHLVINNILVDDNKTLHNITDDIEIKSLVLEIKFICLNKILIDNISSKFKKNNLKILNLYCASYVKTINYIKKYNIENYVIFIDIGFERSTGLIFNHRKLQFFKSIPLGGNSVTKDISNVLRLNYEYSENLKKLVHKNEKEISFNNIMNKHNLYNEISKKNISINLLKQIIESRLDEIIELAVFKSNYIKNLNYLEKPQLVLIGRGSRLLSNDYNLNIKKLVSEISNHDEIDSQVCKAGFDYHHSLESVLVKIKKKVKKSGFFETFFNLFSK